MNKLARSTSQTFYLSRTFEGHYNNTCKDFTYNDFTENINKCNITYMLLFTVSRKVSYR